MITLALAALCWFAFRRMWEREPRRLRAALLFLLTVYLAGSAGVEIASYVVPGFGLVFFVVLLLLPLTVFVLAANLVRNGLVMRRKEGRSLGNSLSLLAGLALFAAPLAAIALALTFQPVAIGISVLIGLGSLQLGVQFLVFWTFFRLYQRRDPRTDPDAVVVLGSGLIRGKVPPLLRNRLDRGREVLAALPAHAAGGRGPLLVTSGGQGADEPVPEGQAMREYLLEQGLEEDRVRAETSSRTTRQNLLLSRRLVDEDTGPEAPRRQLLVVTNGYHVPRTALLSRQVGIEADVVGAPTARYFVPSAFIREFVAVLRMHRALNIALAGLGLLAAVGSGLLLAALQAG